MATTSAQKRPVDRIKESDWRSLETLIDELEEEIPSLKDFILPGGSSGAAFLHLARVVCRRAEREWVALMKVDQDVNSELLIYLNRLSDLLFVGGPIRERPGRRKGGDLAKGGLKTTETCSACRGSGWLVETEDSVEAVVPCPECRPKEGLKKLFQKAAIPPRYFDRGFEEFFFERNSLQERAQLRAIDYVEDFPNVPRGLLFAGPCGVGKTHLSVAILKTPDSRKARPWPICG